MTLLKAWDKINDIIGATPFHPQYFVIKAERVSEKLMFSLVKGKVIDIGCGRQLLKPKLVDLGHKYTSLDHPKIYKRQRGETKPDVLCDITNIPLENNSFESALLLMVLAHLPKPQVGLKEIHRILKKNGYLFVSSIENYPAHDLPDDFFRYRIAGLQAICEDSGFKIIKKYSWGNVWQVNAINFNMFILQSMKQVWDNNKNLFLILLMTVFFYPLIFISNILAIILSPLDRIKTSRLINFVVAQK